MAASDLVNLSALLDDAKRFAFIRQHRWPEKTGDKVVEGFDLGLSALGMDDEAAGLPNTPEQVTIARTLENRDAPKSPAAQSAKASKPGRPALWIIVGVFAALLAALALVAPSGRG